MGLKRHIHGVIDHLKLTVTHKTLRTGSPYKLQLEKREELFEKRAEIRKQREILLEKLSGLFTS